LSPWTGVTPAIGGAAVAGAAPAAVAAPAIGLAALAVAWSGDVRQPISNARWNTTRRFMAATLTQTGARRSEVF
jgi:hypothetical protein